MSTFSKFLLVALAATFMPAALLTLVFESPVALFAWFLALLTVGVTVALLTLAHWTKQPTD